VTETDPADRLLETERLALRPWTLLDLPTAVPLYTDPVLMRHMGDRPLTAAAVEGALRATIARYETHGLGFQALLLRDTGEIIGHCGVQTWEGTTDVELGWLLARRHWGKGYATEAATAVRDWGFANLKVPRLVAVADPENERSIAVMERIGMARVGPADYKGHEVVMYEVRRPDRAGGAAGVSASGGAPR
jgi:RimJ/RimL family protein N-acetyltransferase